MAYCRCTGCSRHVYDEDYCYCCDGEEDCRHGRPRDDDDHYDDGWGDTPHESD